MNEWLQNNYMIVSVIVVLAGALISIGIWVGRVNSDRASLMEFMREIRSDVKKIFERLPPAPVTSNSPLELTDFGKRIAEQFKAEEWANELAPTLLGEVKGKEPFEIDEFCDTYVRDKLRENIQRRVALSAYSFGTDRKGVRSVLRVVLRKKLLELQGKPE